MAGLLAELLFKELVVGRISAAGSLLLKLFVGLLSGFIFIFVVEVVLLVGAIFFLVLFVEFVLVELILFEVVVLVADLGRGAGDVVDRHLAQHSAEVGSAFQRLLFDIVDFFDRARVDR